MKNTFGSSVCVTLFGESHGEQIGAVIDGLAPGIKIDKDYINSKLNLRKPSGKISTFRKEGDEFTICSGVFDGKTTGTPICILIPNTNTKSADYSIMRATARPGHADYTAYQKYHGYEDYRGGGHFSGRITAPLVAVGAICQSALEQKGIFIGTHIKSCAGIFDRDFEELSSDIESLSKKEFAVLDESKESEMKEAIISASNDGDSVGGILETAVIGVPAGIGEPWFDSVESVLSHILFSIPGLKGVQFGMGFDMANHRGSKVNDIFYTENGKVYTKTNNNGGINGGITNGMPITFSCVMKPTPSIFKEQDTINFIQYENKKLEIKGRHDPAIIHRARVVVDSVTAIALCDILTQRYGTDFLFSGESI